MAKASAGEMGAGSAAHTSLGLQHTMPLLLINLGGEMLYILEQRLSAQNVQSEKSVRVLCDVVRTMFSRRFVIELFKPQWMRVPSPSTWPRVPGARARDAVGTRTSRSGRSSTSWPTRRS